MSIWIRARSRSTAGSPVLGWGSLTEEQQRGLGHRVDEHREIDTPRFLHRPPLEALVFGRRQRLRSLGLVGALGPPPKLRFPTVPQLSFGGEETTIGDLELFFRMRLALFPVAFSHRFPLSGRTP